MKRVVGLAFLALVGCGQRSVDDAPDAAVVTEPPHETAITPRLSVRSGVRATFERALVRIDHGDRSFALRVDELRRGDARLALEAGAPRMESDGATIDRGHGVREWWKEKRGTLEVGWTLASRPLDGPLPLALPLAFEGVTPEVEDAAIVLRRDGAFAARLDGLEVRDAQGALVPARFATLDGAPAIVVDDAHATYPITIDPVLGVLAPIVATPPGTGYGRRVAIDDDVAVVTTYRSTFPTVTYEARVYRRSAPGATWSLEQTLTGTRNNFSEYVSLSGDTLILGDVLFERTGGTWVEKAVLPSWLHAVSGSTLVVANATSGASHLVIWTRGSGGWAYAGTLATGAPHAVALRGSTLAVGVRASGSDTVGSVKTYTGSGTSWTLRSTLAPIAGDRNFAGPANEQRLAVTDDTIAIVASADVTAGGNPVLYLGSPLGTSASLQRFDLAAMKSPASVAASNGIAIVGFPNAASDGKTDSGAAHVYARAGSTWSFRDSFVAPVRFNYDHFGQHLAISGEDALVAAPGYSNGGVTMNGGMAFELYPVLAWPNGHACTSGASCASGFCVDGVCCNTACTESCKACNLAGTTGTCANVPADSMPVGDRVCAPAKRCAAGGVCATTCTSATDCATGGACIDGTCQGKRANGAPCESPSDCTSGFCVDGVCCDSACTAQCMACDVPTKQGTCWNVTGAPHGSRAPCAGPGAGTECGPVCDGSDGAKCNYLPSGTVACGADACDPTTRIETRKGTCDGAGACSGGSVSCGAYACGATTCKTNCANNDDCAPGYVCGADALCKAISTLGVACTSATDCESPLTCVDGVCCAESSCPSGSACNLAGSKGECRKKLGTPCSSDAECAAGRFCADGVCCDKACTGTCEACDVEGKEGTCSPVLGAPRTTHPPCETSEDVCGIKQCDGNARTTCEAFATPKGTECKPAQCSEGGVQPRATCDGAGSCLTPPTQSCGNYACEASACKTACTTDEDCAAGFVCSPEGRCVDGARCSNDGLSSIAKDGTINACAPYRCGPRGVCDKSCETSADCAPGYVCEGSSGTCLATAGTTEDDSGCAFGRGRAIGVGHVAVAIAALLLGRRRRRA